MTFWTYGIPLEDELRQVAEKTLLGAIDFTFYPLNADLVFPVGRSLFALDVFDLDYNPVPLSKGGARQTFIVLPFQMDACSLKGHLQRLLSFSQLGGESPAAVVLSTRCDSRVVRDLVREGSLPKKTYFVHPTAFGLDEYVTRLTPSNPSFLVVIDERGVVIRREVLS